MKFFTYVFAVTAASSAAAHTIFVSVNGGKVGDGVRVPSYDGVCCSFILHVASFGPLVIKTISNQSTSL